MQVEPAVALAVIKHAVSLNFALTQVYFSAEHDYDNYLLYLVDSAFNEDLLYELESPKENQHEQYRSG
jgi:hypothetical protein